MLKDDVTIAEVNNLLHALAATLDEEGRTLLYDECAEARLSGDPKELMEAILTFMRG